MLENNESSKKYYSLCKNFFYFFDIYILYMFYDRLKKLYDALYNQEIRLSSDFNLSNLDLNEQSRNYDPANICNPPKIDGSIS